MSLFTKARLFNLRVVSKFVRGYMRLPAKSILLFLVLLAIVIFPSFSFSEEVTLFDQAFVRVSGKPVTENILITVPAPAEEYNIIITNGNADGSNRCSSADADINGIVIIRPSDLNQNVYIIERSVQLDSTNLLKVELRSKPGCFLNIKIIGIDWTPPQVVITDPNNADILGSAETQVSGTIDDPHAAVTVNGVSATNSGGTFQAVIPLVYGDNNIQADATDFYNNPASDSISVISDTVAPVITLDQTPEYISSNTIDITGTIDDITETTVSIQGQSVVVPAGGGPFTFTVNLTEGFNTFIVAAEDSAANSSDESRTITSDTNAPVITIDPTPEYISSSTLDLSGSIDDITETTVSIQGQSAVIPAGGGTYSFTVNLIEGLNTLIVSAVDSADNSDTASRDITSDTIDPAVQITSPADGAFIAENATAVSGTIVDATPSTVIVQGQNIALPSGGGPFSFTVTLTEGSNVITADVTDSADNIGSHSITVTSDTIPPEITINSTPEYISSNTMTLSGSIVDATATTVSIQGQNQTVPAGGGNFSFTVTLTEGANTLTVSAVDSADNPSEASRDIISDTIDPVVHISLPLDGAFIAAAETTVSGSISDATPTTVTVNGTGVPVDNGNFTLASLYLAEGANTITATATDAAGNTSSAVVTVTSDTNPPVLSIDPIPEYTAGSTVTISGNITDLTETTVSVQGQSAVIPAGGGAYSFVIDLNEGLNNLTVTAVDSAGNTSDGSVTITSDTTDPVVQINSPADSDFIAESTTDVSGSVTDATAVTVEVNGISATVSNGSFSVSGVPLSEGSNPITATATDIVGNQGSDTVTVTSDTEPPVISLNPLPQYTSGSSIELSGSVSDLTETTVSIQGQSAVIPAGGGSFSFTIDLSEGLNTLTVNAVDSAGNSSTESRTVTLDTIAPVVQITVPAEGVYIGAAFTEVSGSITDSSPATVSVNGVSAAVTGSTFTVSSVPLVEGSNTITAIAVDAAGNAGSDSITIISDTTPPVVTIDSPADGLLTNVITHTVSGSVTDASPIDLVMLNTLQLPLVSGVFSQQYSLEEGTNTLTVTATDRANNSGSASVEVTLDTIPPGPPSINPLPQITNASSITVSGTTEAGAIVKVSGQGETTADSSGNFSISVNLTLNILNSLSATATDEAGNEGPPALFSILQDAVPPAVTGFTLLADPKVTLDIPVSISFTETLDPATVNSSNITIEGPSGFISGSLNLSGSDVVFTPSAEFPANQMFTLTVGTGVKDPAGNNLASVFTGTFETLRGPAFILGEVYDDTLGLPIEGASAQILTINSEVPDPAISAFTDEMGRFSFEYEGAVGDALVEITMDGYTKALRKAYLYPNKSSQLFDIRLTPNETVTVTVSGGGVLASGDTVLNIPAFAIEQDMQTSIAELSQQGMGYRLPLGWSPMYGVDISPWSITLNNPAVLSIKNIWLLTDTNEFAVAYFDEVTMTWISENASLAGDYINVNVSILGQYFLILPDVVPTAPVMPTAAGEIIQPSIDVIPDTGTAVVEVVPPAVLSSEDAQGMTGVLVTTQEPIPSGTLIEARITEKYNLTNDEVITTEPFSQDIILYSWPDDENDNTLSALFPTTPSKYYPFGTLYYGKVDIDISMQALEEEPVENVIGDNGGTVTGTGGISIIIPASSLTDETLFSLDTLPEEELPVAGAPDLTFLGAMSLQMEGGSFAQDEFPQFVIPGPAVDGMDVILTKVAMINGQSVLTAVATGTVTGGNISITNCLTNDCISTGRYAFYNPERPVGFISGQVSKSGVPISGVVMDVDNLPFTAQTDINGNYLVLSLSGSYTVFASEPGTGLTASAAGAIAGGETISVYLTLSATRPEVTEITPHDKATEVNPADGVEVTFSKPVNLATVNSTSFKVLQEQPGIDIPPLEVEGYLSLQSGNTVAVFVPEFEFEQDTIFTVSLTEDIMDEFGEALVAFKSVFTTKDVLGNEALEPGVLTASMPDENGYITIRGGIGLSPAETPVVFFNRTKDITVTVISATDGSFVGTILADLGDKIEVHVEDLLGNITILDPGLFQNPDGTAAVGPDGGTIHGPGGITTFIPEGAFDETIELKVTMVSEDVLQDVTIDTAVRTIGVFQVEMGDTVAKEELKVSVPAPEWVTSDHQILLNSVINIRGFEELTLACPAVLQEDVSGEQGRTIYSTSPPFDGLVKGGTYGFTTWHDPETGVGFAMVETWSYYGVGYVMGAFGFDFAAPEHTKRSFPITIPVNQPYEVVLSSLNDEPLVSASIMGPPARGEFIDGIIKLSDDDVPPEVYINSIPDGAVSVFPNDNITILMNEPVDPDTVNTDTVIVRDSKGNIVEGTVYLAADGMTIVFVPRYGYKYGETYTIEINGVKDWGGNQIAPYTSTFSTFRPEILSTIDVPYAMAIDKYKNNIVVKGVNVGLGVGLVHSSLIHIIDVLDPRSPFVTGTTDLGGYVLDLKIIPDMGDFMVAVGGRMNSYGKLDVLDLNNLEAQFIYLSYSPQYGTPPLNVPYGGGSPNEVEVLGTNAYVATTGIGIQAIDLTQVTPPHETAQANAIGGTITGSSYSAISSLKNNLLAIKSGELTILSPQLTVIGTISGFNYPSGVTGVEDFPIDLDNDGNTGHFEDEDGDPMTSEQEKFDLALVLTSDGIVIIDVTTPSSPQKMDMIPVPAWKIQVDRYNRLAYTSLFSVISFKDLRPLSNPALYGVKRDKDSDGIDDRVLYTMPEASGMDMVLNDYGDLAYIADYSGGKAKIVKVGLPAAFAGSSIGRPFALERAHHLSRFDSSVPSNIGSDTTDSYKVFDVNVLKQSLVQVKIFDHDMNEMGVLIEELDVDPASYSFVVDYEAVANTGLSYTGSPEFYIKAIVTPNDGSTDQVITYPGRINEYSDGKMLGQTIVHDVLIQDGSLNLSRQDIELKGRGPQLAFTRSYNNQSTSSRTPKPLGNGWSHNFDMKLMPLAALEYGVGNVPDWVNVQRGKLFSAGDIPDQPETWTHVIVNGTAFKKTGGIWYAERGRHGTLDEIGGSYVYTSKDGTQYTYDIPERSEAKLQTKPTPVRTIADRNGNTMTLSYEGELLKTVTDSVGRSFTFEYQAVPALLEDNSSRLASVTGPDGIVLSFTYDQMGYLQNARRDSRVEQYAYQRESGPGMFEYNLVKTTDANNHSYKYEYYGQNEVDPNLANFIRVLKSQDVIKSVQYPDLSLASFQYNASPVNKRIVTDLRGNDTVYTLNFFGNPKKIEEPDGRTTLMTWSIDEGGDDNVMTSKTDGRGNTTSYEYDAKGNISRETDPYSHSITTVWDQEFSLPESRTDRNSVNQAWNYDAKGNLESFTDGDGKRTEYSYNSFGERESMTDPRTNITTYTYDSYGSPDTVTGPEGSITDFDHDIRGRRIAVTDPNGNKTDYTYDDLDYPDTITYPAITAYSLPAGSTNVQDFDYDAVGSLLSETNRLGLTLNYTYTVRDQVEEITRSIGGIKNFIYDENGNLVSETDWKGNETTHTYDALNQRAATDNRLNDTMNMDYDLSGNLTEVKDYEGNVTRYAYDKLNRLTDTEQPSIDGQSAGHIISTYYDEADPKTNLKTVKDQEGNTTAFEYNGRYQRTKQTNALFDVYQWFYDDSGNLSKETDEEGKYVLYEYDMQNRRTAVVQMGSIRTRYEYDLNGNQTHVIDARLKDTEIRYDEWNRAYRTIDPDNYTTLAEYDGAGNEVKVTDGNSNSRTWNRDSRGLVLTATDAESRSTNYAYDLNGNVETVTDPRGMVTEITYDNEDRELAVTEAFDTDDERIREVLTRDRMGNPTLVKDYNGNISTTEYNDLYLPKKACDPAPFGSQCVETTYYRTGKVKSVKNRRGNTTSFEYDALNREVKVTDAKNQTVETTYDKAGNVKTKKDKRGIITENFYDDLHRLVRTERASLRLVTNEYDDVGNLTAVIDANSNRTENTYNNRNLLDTTTHADTNTEARAYDGVGNLLTHTNEESKVTTYTYDKENRQTSVEFANEKTENTYDANGNLTEVKKPLGNTRTMAYDYLNRLITVVDDPGVLALTTTYEYDANGNLIHQYDVKGNDVEFTYDALNRKTQHIQHKLPLNLITQFTVYDEEGNLKTLIDPEGRTITYKYDELDRQTTANYPDLGTSYNNITKIQTAYDANSNVTSVVETKSGPNPTDTTINTYDNFDRLDTSTQRGMTISYAYDNNGNRISVSTPAGSTTYTFNARNRLETATDGADVTTYAYYPDGKKDTITYPNGTDVKYTYHANNRVETITNKVTSGGTIISSYGYTYDANGNRKTQIEFQDSVTETTAYNYDSLDRLKDFTVTAGANTTVSEYTFEGYNRRTELVRENATVTKSRTYYYDETDWLTTIDDDTDIFKTITYTYDNNGNTVFKSDSLLPNLDTTFIYDARNQLVETKRGPPGSEVVLGQYDYNAGGLRVRHRQSERGDVDYYYDGTAVIEEHNASNGSLLAHYRYADRLLSLDTGTTTQYYHHDALGSTVNLTNTAGAIQVSYKLDPWGRIKSQTGTSVNRQIFTGQEHDENTGLIYFGARYYDPDTARFLTQDSYLGEPGTPPSLHRYLYAYSNPTVYFDPNGNITLLKEGAEALGYMQEGLRERTKLYPAEKWYSWVAAGATGISRGVLGAGEMFLRGVNYGANWGSLAVVGVFDMKDVGWAETNTQEIRDSNEAMVNAYNFVVKNGVLKSAGVITYEGVQTVDKALEGDLAAYSDVAAFVGDFALASGVSKQGLKIRPMGTREFPSKLPDTGREFLGSTKAAIKNSPLGNNRGGVQFGKGKKIDGKITSKREAIVVGEDVDRLKVFAADLEKQGIKVHIYPAPNMNRKLNPNAYGSPRSRDANWHWLDYWARRKGVDVYDIGLKPGRVNRSRYYKMESRNLIRWERKGQIGPVNRIDPGY